MTSVSRRRRCLAGLLMLLAGLAAGAYGLVAVQQPGYRTPSPAGSLPSPTNVGSLPSPTPVGRDFGGLAKEPPAPVKHVAAVPVLPPPDQLSLPRLGVSAKVVPVAVSASGALAVPADPRVLGWWNGSRAVEGGQGSVVIVGHVDAAARGKGAFFHLARAAPGDDVRVGSAQREMNYRVVARRAFRKAALPQDIFSSHGPPYLVLITCGGPFDERTRHYRDNVVVYALPR